MFGGFGFNSLCPAPSIPSADEKTRRLSEPRRSLREGGVSFGGSERRLDAQDEAGHGRFLLVRFLFT